MTRRAAWSFILLLLCLIPVYAQDANAPQEVLPQTYTEIATLGYGQISGASWRPDGNAIIVNSTHGATIYSLDFEPLHHFEGAQQAAFSPDGDFLAATIRDPYQIVIWETDTYTRIKALDLSFEPPHPESSGSGLTMAWSPDALQIAVSGMNTNIVDVFEVESGQSVMSLAVDGRITDLTWRPDGHRLAVTYPPNVMIIDPLRGDTKSRMTLDDNIKTFWSPDQQTLATVGLGISGGHYSGNDIKLWDTDGQTLKLVIQSPYIAAFAWSPDSQTIATGELFDQGYVTYGAYFWDARTGERVGWLPRQRLDISYQKAFTSFAWNPTGTQFMTSSADNVVRIFDWPFVLETRPRELLGYQGSITGVAWNGDGTQIIASSEDTSLNMWDVASGQAIARLQSPNRIPIDVTWNAKLPQIALTTETWGVYAWDFLTGEPINGFARYSDEYPSVVAYSPDGKILASAGLAESGGQVSLSLVNTSQEPLKTLTRLDHLDRPVWSLSWSQDSSRIAYNNGLAYVYDLKSETTTSFDCLGPKSHEIIYTVALSPDGHILAAADDHGRLCLWDVDAQTPIPLDYSGRTSLASASADLLVWNPDGVRIATVTKNIRFDSATNTHFSRLSVWDITTQTLITEIETPYGIGDLAWSPDGTRLVAGDTEGVIHIWQQP